jgi:hypothetical protein
MAESNAVENLDAGMPSQEQVNNSRFYEELQQMRRNVIRDRVCRSPSLRRWLAEEITNGNVRDVAALRASQRAQADAENQTCEGN